MVELGITENGYKTERKGFMNRENNKYINTISGETLTALEMNTYVQSETKRQYEELTGDDFETIPADEQMDMYLSQWDHQLHSDWKVIE